MASSCTPAAVTRERCAGQVIVVRVEHEREAVRFGVLIAPRRAAWRFARVRDRSAATPTYSAGVVVRDPQFGAFARRFALVGLALGERRGCGRPQPDLIVEAAVNRNRGRRAHGLNCGDGRVSRLGLTRRCGRSTHDRCEQSNEKAAQHGRTPNRGHRTIQSTV